MTKFKHPLSFDALESLMSVLDKNDQKKIDFL